MSSLFVIVFVFDTSKQTDCCVYALEFTMKWKISVEKGINERIWATGKAKEREREAKKIKSIRHLYGF